MSTVISKVDAKTNPPERPGVLELIAPFWVSEQRWRAWPIVAILLAGTFGGAYVSLWANRLLGEVTDALIGRQWDVLWPALVMSALAAIISTTNTHGREALQNLLELRWRTWLTAQLLREWSERSVFYDIEREGLLSNADQRIADDVRLFVENTLNIVLHLISVVVNAVTYIVLLWQLSGVLSFMLGGTEVRIPGYMVYLAVLYALCSFLLAHWMGKALVG
ncbi:MAG: ABC transporter ATP-binding protein/permease, partial [Duganella sp.]